MNRSKVISEGSLCEEDLEIEEENHEGLTPQFGKATNAGEEH